MGKDGKNATRVTTTLSKDLAVKLKRAAEKNKVKEAWLVRVAVDHYLSEMENGKQLPLDFRIK